MIYKKTIRDKNSSRIINSYLIKVYIPAFCLLLFLFSSLFCTDKGKIFSAIENDKELKEGDSVPFLLQQNFPNPFSGLTQIEYKLAVTSHVKLKVFTEDWQEVAILVNQTKPAGTHSAMFNYSQKKDLHSGEYYYVMEVLGVKQIRKMKLIE